jgi:serine/threonine-protein kinase
MHELLTGEVPFLGKTSRETLEIMHTTRVPTAAGDHGAGLVTDSFAKLVQRCMAKRPEERPQSADELRTALLEIAEAGSDRDDRTQMIGALPRRKKRGSSARTLNPTAVLGMAFSFAIGLVAGLAIMGWR